MYTPNYGCFVKVVFGALGGQVPADQAMLPWFIAKFLGNFVMEEGPLKQSFMPFAALSRPLYPHFFRPSWSRSSGRNQL